MSVPTQRDVAAHKGAVTREKKRKAKLAARFAEVSTPVDLAVAILEQSMIEYRRSPNRRFEVKVDVPWENFDEWARSREMYTDKPTDHERDGASKRIKNEASALINLNVIHGFRVTFELNGKSKEVLKVVITVLAINPQPKS